MSLRKHVVMLAYYHRWATRRLFNSLRPLEDQAFVAAAASPAARSPLHPYRADLALPMESVHGTLCHLLFAEQLWMARFRGEAPSPALAALWTRSDSHPGVWAEHFATSDASPFGPSPAAAATPPATGAAAATPYSPAATAERAAALRSKTEVQFALDETSGAWIPLCQGLTEQDLQGKLEYRSTSAPASAPPTARARLALVTHVFNHATHHRGQVSAAVAQMGVPYPRLDLSEFLPEWDEIHSKAFKWA